MSSFSDSTKQHDPLDLLGGSDIPAITTLFERIAQMDQLSVELDRLSQLSKTRRERWVRKYEPQLLAFMDQLVDTSDVAIEHMQGDAQEIALSVEYVTKLRQVANQAKSLLESDLSQLN